MKNRPLLIATLSLTPFLGMGQEIPISPSPTYFCVDGDLEKCQITDPNTQQIIGEVPDATATLDWESLPEAKMDPKSNIPGTCPSKQEYALAAWVSRLNSGNPNTIIESYYWTGLGIEQEEPIVNRLLSISAMGHWEKSIIASWNGMEEDKKKVPKHLRWLEDDGSVTYFILKKAEGCWFLSFASAPEEQIQIPNTPAFGKAIPTEIKIENTDSNFIIID